MPAARSATPLLTRTRPGANPNAWLTSSQCRLANGTALGDDGINDGSYSFSSPHPLSLNTIIAKHRFHSYPTKHRFFVRGNLQKDITDDAEQFPGQGPSNSTQTTPRAFSAGDTWTIYSEPHQRRPLRLYPPGFQPARRRLRRLRRFPLFVHADRANPHRRSSTFPLTTSSTTSAGPKASTPFEVGGNWRLIIRIIHSDDTSRLTEPAPTPTGSAAEPPDPTTLAGLACSRRRFWQLL